MATVPDEDTLVKVPVTLESVKVVVVIEEDGEKSGPEFKGLGTCCF